MVPCEAAGERTGSGRSGSMRTHRAACGRLGCGTRGTRQWPARSRGAAPSCSGSAAGGSPLLPAAVSAGLPHVSRATAGCMGTVRAPMLMQALTKSCEHGYECDTRPTRVRHLICQGWSRVRAGSLKMLEEQALLESSPCSAGHRHCQTSHGGGHNKVAIQCQS